MLVCQYKAVLGNNESGPSPQLTPNRNNSVLQRLIFRREFIDDSSRGYRCARFWSDHRLEHGVRHLAFFKFLECVQTRIKLGTTGCMNLLKNYVIPNAKRNHVNDIL